MSDSKYCEYCKSEYARKKVESNWSWLKRRFCSTSCSTKNKIVDGRVRWIQQLKPRYIPPKNCLNCGKAFSATKSFSMATWAKTRFCSVSCATKKQWENARSNA